MKKGEAVIFTGDIVNSSALGSEGLALLRDEVALLLASHALHYHFYRGDSFQALALHRKSALELAARIRIVARLARRTEKKADIDIRIAIGIGKIQEPITDIASGRGEAFELSGHELDRITQTGCRLSIKGTNELTNAAYQSIAAFVDFIIRKLTVPQAIVFLHLLSGKTETEIAALLGKSQPTINKSKQAANWSEFAQMVVLFRKIADIT